MAKKSLVERFTNSVKNQAEAAIYGAVADNAVSLTQDGLAKLCGLSNNIVARAMEASVSSDVGGFFIQNAIGQVMALAPSKVARRMASTIRAKTYVQMGRLLEKTVKATFTK